MDNSSSNSLPGTDPDPNDAPPSPASADAVTPAPSPPPSPPPGSSPKKKDSPSSKKDSQSKKNVPPSGKDAPMKVQTRPTGLSRTSTTQTQFMTMVLGQHEISRIYNILASFFTWILLAGFVILPGTFTTIGEGQHATNGAVSAIAKTIQSVPLLVVAYVCAGIGAVGMLWLWFLWRKNYVWLLNKIFLPGCLNSSAGLLSTLIGIYFQQDGTWSTTAKATVCVTGGCMAVTGVMFIIYDFWILRKVKKRHSREIASGAAREAEHEGKGIFKKMVGMAMGSALDPESVV